MIPIKFNIQETALIRSFKAKGFIHVVLLDFFYYAILLFLGSFYVYKILPTFLNLLDAVDLLQNGQLFSSGQEFLTQTDAMSANWLSFKIYTIVIAVVLFLNYCIFKYLIWKKIQQRQQTVKELLKGLGLFTLANLILFVGYGLLAVFSYYILVLESFNIFVFFVLPIIIMYTQNLIHPLFVDTQCFGESLKQYYTWGIKRFYRFIIPYCIMFILLIAVIYIVPLLVFLPPALYTIWYVLVFVIYFSWTKYYMFAILKPVAETPQEPQKQKIHIPSKRKR